MKAAHFSMRPNVRQSNFCCNYCMSFKVHLKCEVLFTRTKWNLIERTVILTNIIVKSYSICLLGRVAKTSRLKYHFSAVIRVGPDPKQTCLSIHRELVKPHRTYKCDMSGLADGDTTFLHILSTRVKKRFCVKLKAQVWFLSNPISINEFSLTPTPPNH